MSWNVIYLFFQKCIWVREDKESGSEEICRRERQEIEIGEIVRRYIELEINNIECQVTKRLRGEVMQDFEERCIEKYNARERGGREMI